MRIKNSSRYPSDTVRDIVQFACRGVKMDRVQVHVKNSVSCAYRGRAYQGVPSVSPAAKCATVDYLVTVSIGTPDRYPCSNWSERLGHAYGGKRAPRIEMQTWQEGMLAVAAHEARHIWQFRNGKPMSEVDCERFAARRLGEWRKREGENRS